MIGGSLAAGAMALIAFLALSGGRPVEGCMASIYWNSSFLNNEGKRTATYRTEGHDKGNPQYFGPDGKALTGVTGVKDRADKLVSLTFYEDGSLATASYTCISEGTRVFLNYDRVKSGPNGSVTFGPDKDLKHGALTFYTFESANKLPYGVKPFTVDVGFKDGHIVSYNAATKDGTQKVSASSQVGTSLAEFSLKAPGLAKPLELDGKGGIDALNELNPALLFAAGNKVVVEKDGGVKVSGHGGASLISFEGGKAPPPPKVLGQSVFAKGPAIDTGSMSDVAGNEGSGLKYTSEGTPVVQSELISNDGGGLVSHDGGGLIGNDGGGLISNDGGGLVASGGGNIISPGGAGRVAVHGSAFQPLAKASSVGGTPLTGAEAWGEAFVDLADTDRDGVIKDRNLNGTGPVGDLLELIRGIATGGGSIKGDLTSVAKAQADLVPLDVTVNRTTLLAGQTLEVNWKTANVGKVALDGSTSFAWLSKDKTIGDKDDIKLGSDASGILLPKYFAKDQVTYDIPSTLAPGSYYVIVNVNGDGGARESNGANNQSTPIAVKIVSKSKSPDLTVSKATLSKTKGAAGETVKVEYTLKENNFRGIDASKTALYISKDAKIDSSDKPFLPVNADAKLSAGGSTNSDFTFKVPDKYAPGTYYVFVKANYDGKAKADGKAVSEPQANNLSGPMKFTIGAPDLTIKKPSLSAASGSAGDTIKVEYTLQEAAGFAAKPSKTALFLSKDMKFDAGDTAVTLTPDPGLDPALSAGGSANSDFSFKVPSGLLPGEYYAIVQANADGKILHEPGANNFSTPVKFTIKPSSTTADLTIRNVSLDKTTVTAGDTISAQYMLKEVAGLAPPASCTAVVLSADNVITPGQNGDRIIGLPNNDPGFGPGGSYFGDIDFQVPGHLAGGTYYIGLATNLPLKFPEANLANNLSQPIAITVKPASTPTGGDLTIGNFTLDKTSFTAGDSITYSYTVKDTGSEISSYTMTKIFLSKDTFIDEADQQLFSTYTFVQPGAEASKTSTLQFPADVVPGDWFVIAMTDANKTKGESNELNNLAAPIAITVTGGATPGTGGPGPGPGGPVFRVAPAAMNGSAGADTFLFDDAPGAPVARVKGFGPGDRIALAADAFDGLGHGALCAQDLHFGRASGDHAQVVYDAERGDLSFDADGAGGQDAIRFAHLAGAPSLSAADFIVV